MTPTTPTTETVMIDGDPTVGRIGYGAMQPRDPTVSGRVPDHDEGAPLLREAVASGVTFIDTGPSFRAGETSCPGRRRSRRRSRLSRR
jgi:aryl-alcohol dehydrogenase-like predicted oxidoreductase